MKFSLKIMKVYFAHESITKGEGDDCYGPINCNIGVGHVTCKQSTLLVSYFNMNDPKHTRKFIRQWLSNKF